MPAHPAPIFTRRSNNLGRRRELLILQFIILMTAKKCMNNNNKRHSSVLMAPLLLLLLAWIVMPASGQTYSVQDSVRVMAKLKEVKDSVDLDRRKALKKTLDAVTLSGACGFRYGVAVGLQESAFIYMKETRYDSAINAANAAIKICREYGYTSTQIESYVDLGIVYEFLGDYTGALEKYKLALKASDRSTDTAVMMDLYSNFGNLMQAMEDFDNAKTYLLTALKLGLQHKTPLSVAKIYLQLGIVSLNQGRYNDLLLYMNKCIRLCDSLHVTGPAGAAYQGLGIYYSDSAGKYDSAQYFYLKSVAVYKERRDTFNEAGALCNIGNLYYEKLKNPAIAEKYYKESLYMGIRSSNLLNVIDCENSMALLYAKNNDYKKAYEHRTAQVTIRDSLYNKQKIAAAEALNNRLSTLELQNKNTSLEKQAEIQQLRLQHRGILLYGGLVFLVMLLAGVLLLMRHNKLRANQKLLQLEQKQLLAQINPHFIFNCLNSVQQFVVQNDIENANKYLVDFSMLMRQTLDNSSSSTITLSKEIEYLENYLSLESMRFESLFSYKIACDGDLDINNIEIPSMVIQPYVENAIIHGLSNLDGKNGSLVITFYKKGDILFCEVDDNGIGMKIAEELRKQSFIKHSSKGMEMTKLRLLLLSKLDGVDYKISVINKTDAGGVAQGTTIIIKFPQKNDIRRNYR